MDKTDQAVNLFKQSYSCSQSVFSVYAKDLGVDMDIAHKIAGAFGGGMARMGETCGAVTGAFMAIGLKYGKTDPEDKAAQEKKYDDVRTFVDRFKSIHGSIVCRELTGCDLGTPEGLNEFKEKNIHETHCVRYVKDAVDMLERLI